MPFLLPLGMYLSVVMRRMAPFKGVVEQSLHPAGIYMSSKSRSDSDSVSEYARNVAAIHSTAATRRFHGLALKRTQRGVVPYEINVLFRRE